MITSSSETVLNASFTHRLLPYDGADQFLDGAVPFLLDGLDGGDRVLAVCGTGQEMLLRDALGPADAGVEFAEPSSWYAHPARTLADCLSQADDAVLRGSRLRLLGEPAWASRSPLEVLEWQRIEAVLNVAFRGTGASLMCPYSATLPAGTVAAARKTHPETVRGGRSLTNPGFIDPWAYCEQCDREPLPHPPPGADTLEIEQADLYWLRAYVTDYARQTPLPDEDRKRLLIAVTEVVTNAMRHGEPPIVLRMWTEDGAGGAAFVCEVADEGRWAPGTGYGLIPPRPPGTAAGSRFGLWAVRLLCSTVQVRTGDRGSVVRLRLDLDLPARTGPSRPNGE
ncbi:sensor histidine kinase [Actinomadura sp. KC345]|uniref:sensor histidine kinase n=1 Tax=Actinomadura sp. KC345 TaxID=2530371 RepID=UPI00104D8DE0|nr:sensor histidine kinase [Actinomadura sp. KC345]TDC58103.1 sensor histidine kinase [Actinomadura sp. KC345]